MEDNNGMSSEYEEEPTTEALAGYCDQDDPIAFVKENLELYPDWPPTVCLFCKADIPKFIPENIRDQWFISHLTSNVCKIVKKDKDRERRKEVIDVCKSIFIERVPTSRTVKPDSPKEKKSKPKAKSEIKRRQSAPEPPPRTSFKSTSKSKKRRRASTSPNDKVIKKLKFSEEDGEDEIEVTELKCTCSSCIEDVLSPRMFCRLKTLTEITKRDLVTILDSGESASTMDLFDIFQKKNVDKPFMRGCLQVIEKALVCFEEDLPPTPQNVEAQLNKNVQLAKFLAHGGSVELVVAFIVDRAHHNAEAIDQNHQYQMEQLPECDNDENYDRVRILLLGNSWPAKLKGCMDCQ